VDRAPRAITGTHLFQRERCARHVWLDFHGDPDRRLPPDAAAARAMALGREHERAIVAKLEVVEPSYPATDLEAGARATAELMREGAPLIYQGVVTAPGRVGKPDLLRRGDDGRYVVGDVKLASAPKVEHAMQVAFYADVLAGGQDGVPTKAFLVLGDGREAEVRLDEVEPLYRSALAEVEAIREARHEPRPHLRPFCSGCAWRGVCLPEMEERGDLSLVFGVTPARRDALAAAGIAKVTELAACDPASVAERTELPRETLRRLRLQARALLDGAPMRLGPIPWRSARIAWTAAIGRDGHGRPTAFAAYRTARAGDALEERWVGEIARDPDDEARAYRRFVVALAEDLDAPIYHFGEALPETLSRLDAKHGKRSDPIAEVFARLVDVQSGIRSALVLPTPSYELQRVADALGGVAQETKSGLDSPLAAAADEAATVRRVRMAAARAWSACA